MVRVWVECGSVVGLRWAKCGSSVGRAWVVVRFSSMEDAHAIPTLEFAISMRYVFCFAGFVQVHILQVHLCDSEVTLK